MARQESGLKKGVGKKVPTALIVVPSMFNAMSTILLKPTDVGIAPRNLSFQ